MGKKIIKPKVTNFRPGLPGATVDPFKQYIIDGSPLPYTVEMDPVDVPVNPAIVLSPENTEEIEPEGTTEIEPEGTVEIEPENTEETEPEGTDDPLEIKDVTQMDT